MSYTHQRALWKWDHFESAKPILNILPDLWTGSKFLSCNRSFQRDTDTAIFCMLKGCKVGSCQIWRFDLHRLAVPLWKDLKLF